MKKFLFLAATFCLAFAGYAAKPVVSVEKFTGSNVPDEVLTSVRNKVLSGAQQAGAVVVIDGTIKAASNSTPDGIMKGNIDNWTCTKNTSKGTDGKTYVTYSGKLNYTLTITDTADGSVISQKNFEQLGTGNTEAEALQSLIDVKVTPVKQFVLNAFASGGKIVAGDVNDGKKMKTVYIDLGSDHGLAKGRKLEVFKEVEIAGSKSRKSIGELQVQEVMSADRALCKVTKGGELVLTELEAGTTLPVQTKEEKSNFFKQIVED